MSEEQIIAFLEHNATRGDVVAIVFVTIMVILTLALIRALIVGD